jgi:hypothetical protein
MRIGRIRQRRRGQRGPKPATRMPGLIGSCLVCLVFLGALPASGAADPPPAPEVSGITPNHGPLGGGTEVTITGSNFTGATAVEFEGHGGGQHNAPSFTVNSDTSITAISPPGEGFIAEDVVVVGPGGSSPTGPQDRFGYGPIIESTTPNVGPAAGGTTVRLEGFGLEDATEVTFGSTPASSFTANEDGSITAVAPPTIPGETAVYIQVSTPEGITSADGIPDQIGPRLFTYGPTVSGIGPESGPSSGGTAVIIHGSGFETPVFRCLCGAFVWAIHFGSTELKCGLPYGPAEVPCQPVQFEVISDTEIVATAPPGTGEVDLAVETAGGISPAISDARFRYEELPSSILTSEGNLPDRSVPNTRTCLSRVRATFRAAQRRSKARDGRVRARTLRHARHHKRRATRACRTHF